MKLSDYLASFLVKQGVRHVFQIIGGASVHMVHSLADNKDIEYVCVQHEQAGAMAAEAYCRMTKNLGVAMATSGPGMTNLITGIACAYFDSIPLLCITGNVNTTESKQGRNVRQVGFQETDIVEIVRPLTKFSARVENPSDIRYFLEKALFIAKSGRPGPVLLDIPMDVQRAIIDPKKLKPFDPGELDSDVDTKEDIKKAVREAIRLLQHAKRPVLVAGGAIRYADVVDTFQKVVQAIGAPVVATWSGIDTIGHDHPLYRGQIGVYGNRAANFTVQNSDVLVSIGSRLDTRITGGKPETFARGAKKVVIDIDRAELYKQRGLNPDVGICADVRGVLPVFLQELKHVKFPQWQEWKKQTLGWVRDYPSVLPQWNKRKTLVDPYVFIRTLSEALDNKAIVVTDCGANLTWTIQAFHVKQGQRLFSAMGNSPMGYSMAAAIGASMALGKRPIICIIGDGGLQINIQELQTIAHYSIPVKVFILNNHSYGIIKQFQEMYFDSRYEATTPKSGYSVPDFRKIALAYGLPCASITSHVNLAKKIKKVLVHKGPILCDVVIPDDAKLTPKLAFGKPIEDLSPELSREEFARHMIVKPITSEST